MTRLQTGNLLAFKDLVTLCGETLDEYTEPRLGDFRRGKQLNDSVLSTWLAKNFASATDPLSVWILE